MSVQLQGNTQSLQHIPQGFHCIVLNVGVKDNTKDFVCIFSDVQCNAAGVFTQSRFSGPSVTRSRENIKNGRAQAIVAISKNANVANGEQGEADTRTIIDEVANRLAIQSDDVLIGSTGVIGRPYPMDKILAGVRTLSKASAQSDFINAAHGIMTTDTVPKYASIQVGNAALVGIVKGVGMIEPNMATLLAFFFTDAAIERDVLDAMFRRVINKTLNCVSVDTDTSTSDTATILANGLAGPVDNVAFEAALLDIALYLTKQIARDGEGATKLIEVHVDQARDERQAKKVAKVIVNSPLVKTAIHGADPNWGRIAMAIGKCEDELDILPERTIIRFGSTEVFPRKVSASDLTQLERLLMDDTVYIHVSLQTGDAECTVWGCDLSAEYVKINGEYTT
ncbi:bifunctional glutamate N-acetyltransferase/amino-acid acetyltransferase ArgJ [Desulfovibrio inopinatus]|uniref:bifunctional glutamate N-acetyltransferase/amino-acid acetyltransferase ArgJ n=1 Tax=Desulfovibrio inopinatus TaxID=102109 RepID=UPI00040FAC22|nr:bifunctional glutamate N-acetyltransferase/amino-acid acetyltransferase ArgJ [Desulfovibrio inopinatus]